MRGLTATAFVISLVLFLGMHAIAQTTETSPTPAETDSPQGAADDGGVFHPIWIALVGVGFVALVFTGLLMRRRQRRRPPAP